MVEGVAALHARFAKVPDIVKAEVTLELEKQAEQITKEMRQIAPRGRTGGIVAGINWEWAGGSAGGLQIRTARGNEFGRVAITIYSGRTSKDFYARFHEFGTVKMSARPFFFPMFRANRKQAKSALTRAVTRGVKKA